MFITGTHYIGNFGPSIILHGISPTNSKSYDRNIVIHGADYCHPDHITKHGFLGRSLGCIALPKKEMITTYQMLKPGTLIFTSYDTKKPSEKIKPPTSDEILENRIT